ncbi:MAG: hypothetical protein IJK23_11030 [Clostridia bacterium]|nr:hypothetical protein [Clostridia bacterium]
MDLGKKSVRNLILYLVPILCAGLMNAAEHLPVKISVPANADFLHGGAISSLIIGTVCLHWCLSVRRRFPQKHMRNNVSLFASALILLPVLRAVKSAYLYPGATAARYIWYVYYIPMTFGPLFMVHASLYFGKADDFRISKKWRWTYLPAALLSAGVLTNDLHRLAFRFPDGLEHWENYSHGVLYYLTAGWIVLMMLSVIALAIRSTLNRRLLRTAWLPATVLAAVALYFFLYAYPGDHSSIFQWAFGLNDFFCLGSIALWESFVAARIIVSNNGYPAIFAASSLNAGLADGDFQVRQVSENGVRPQPEELRAAAGGETLMPDGDTLLKTRAVQGGWFYWTEDLSELHRLNEALNDTADYLTEENAMLRISAEIEEGRRRTAEQTALYDRVTESLRPQLDALDELLRDLPEDETGFRAGMQRAGVLIAYAKRRGNLLLLADTNPTVPAGELGLCLEESARALRSAGVACEYRVEADAEVPTAFVCALYELFGKTTERTFGSLRSVSVSLEAPAPDRILFELTLETPAEPLTEAELAELRRMYEDVRIERSDTSVRILTALILET